MSRTCSWHQQPSCRAEDRRQAHEAVLPDTQRAVQKWVQLRTFSHSEANYHVLRVFLNYELTLTCKARSSIASRSKPATTLALKWQAITLDNTNTRQEQLVPFASLSAISGTFNSLFKVLFTFPSWYLFAIGLEPIFSFRWNLPPNLRSNPEERDS